MADKKNKNKPYASLPKPINLDVPAFQDVNGLRRRGRDENGGRERGKLPEFDPAPLNGGGSEPRDSRELRVTREPQSSRERVDTRKKLPPPPKLPRLGKKKTNRPPSRGRSILSRIRIKPLYINIVGWSIAGVAMILIAVWFVGNLFEYNAFAVYLDGELVGHMPIGGDEELTSEVFHDRALASLQMSLGGALVQVEQTVTIEKARVSSRERDSSGDILGRLNRYFRFNIAFTAIYVNDRFEALMRTEADLEHLRLLLQERFFNENTVDAEFIENWVEVVRYLCPDETEFDTPDEAYRRLNRTIMHTITYVIRPGDNLGLIAARFGSRVDRIMHDNNLTSDIIHPYNTLQIETARPLLMVRTFDEIHAYEPILMTVVEQESQSLPLAITNVVQEGSHGQQRSTIRITRENGIEVYRETLDAVVVIEPIVHIVEVGIGAPAQEFR